jgi:hypothetical protein
MWIVSSAVANIKVIYRVSWLYQMKNGEVTKSVVPNTVARRLKIAEQVV